MRAHTARKKKDPRVAILQELGERIRGHRQARGLTQQDLAEELNLSVAYVSLIERGARNPPFTRVVAIADALGIAAGDLAG